MSAAVAAQIAQVRRTAATRARSDALDEAEGLIEQTIRDLEETGPRTDGTEVLLLQRLRVAFGLAPRPGTCLAPGFASVVNALPE